MQKCVFVGNRRFVLEHLTKKDFILKVFVIKGSHLDRDFASGLFPGVVYHVVSSKQELLEHLLENDYDLLISNGCPYILPIHDLPSATYVNIHPSFLPDLKGCDPVIGAILNERDAGATCHVMDSGIDTGDIIAQVKIPYTPDLDVTTLYQLSFIAEADVFENAFSRNFVPQCSQSVSENLLYFSRKPEDLIIQKDDSNNYMLQKIKAFNNQSIGCSFFCEGIEYQVFKASKVINSYLTHHVMSFGECQVALSYENSVIFHRQGEVIRFEMISQQDNIPLQVNQYLFGV